MFFTEKRRRLSFQILPWSFFVTARSVWSSTLVSFLTRGATFQFLGRLFCLFCANERALNFNSSRQSTSLATLNVGASKKAKFSAASNGRGDQTLHGSGAHDSTSMCHRLSFQQDELQPYCDSRNLHSLVTKEVSLLYTL